MEPYQPPESQMYEPPPNRRQQSGYPEPPIEDPFYSGNVVSGLMVTIKSVLFSPADFFRGLRDDRSFAPSFIFAFVVLVGVGLIGHIVNTLTGNTVWEQWGQIFEQMGSDNPFSEIMSTQDDLGPIMTIVMILMIPIQTVLGIAFNLLLYFVFAKLTGAFSRSFGVFARVLFYSYTPYLFMLIPVQALMILNPLFSFLVILYYLPLGLYSFVLLAMGIYYTNEAESSPLRAALAVLLPWVLICLCVMAFTIMMVASIGALGAG
ncbi:YIP1 family protein [Sulfidibacter corallicola]|uniref:YIP1 family protein n=1 Tax=Sulfidibacter corallicola TaxID=2818388 RepID=A0A8A4TTY1_SULCO|nr:YIP1 family protein [Sulfidibacter corallicola]QTD52980.1 YIP1 family protein [Sulfidibacter corallicola]